MPPPAQRGVCQPLTTALVRPVLSPAGRAGAAEGVRDPPGGPEPPRQECGSAAAPQPGHASEGQAAHPGRVRLQAAGGEANAHRLTDGHTDRLVSPRADGEAGH